MTLNYEYFDTEFFQDNSVQFCNSDKKCPIDKPICCGADDGRHYVCKENQIGKSFGEICKGMGYKEDGNYEQGESTVTRTSPPRTTQSTVTRTSPPRTTTKSTVTRTSPPRTTTKSTVTMSSPPRTTTKSTVTMSSPPRTTTKSSQIFCNSKQKCPRDKPICCGDNNCKENKDMCGAGTGFISSGSYEDPTKRTAPPTTIGPRKTTMSLYTGNNKSNHPVVKQSKKAEQEAIVEAVTNDQSNNNIVLGSPGPSVLTAQNSQSDTVNLKISDELKQEIKQFLMTEKPNINENSVLGQSGAPCSSSYLIDKYN